MSGQDHADDAAAAAEEGHEATEAALEELEDAGAAYQRAQERVEEYGREQLETLRERRRTARDLLVGYQDSATDTGAREFVSFAQFKGQFTGLVEDLDDDLPARDAFEDALDAVDKTRLSEDDFRRAINALEPAERLEERLEDATEARNRLVDALSAARERRQFHVDAAERCERLLELGEADLDAPVEDLRAPIETWNDAVREAIDRLRTEASAREFFALLERAEQYPLVDLEAPPAELAEYVETAPVGEEPVARLLEYADFSRSKLAHYVEDADAFRRAVAPERTFLEAIDAEPLTVDWPPPPAEAIPWHVRERRSLAAGIVPEEAVAALRRLRSLAADPARYDRLRDAAIATERLDERDRRRLASGAVSAALEAHRRTVEAIDEAIADAPDP